jgi:hypothetical protein
VLENAFREVAKGFPGASVLGPGFGLKTRRTDPDFPLGSFFADSFGTNFCWAMFCMTALKPNLSWAAFCMTALKPNFGWETFCTAAPERIFVGQDFSRQLWH